MVKVYCFIFMKWWVRRWQLKWCLHCLSLNHAKWKTVGYYSGIVLGGGGLVGEGGELHWSLVEPLTKPRKVLGFTFTATVQRPVAHSILKVCRQSCTTTGFLLVAGNLVHVSTLFSTFPLTLLQVEGGAGWFYGIFFAWYDSCWLLWLYENRHFHRNSPSHCRLNIFLRENTFTVNHVTCGFQDGSQSSEMYFA